jgi:hypothetical protein
MTFLYKSNVYVESSCEDFCLSLSADANEATGEIKV